MSMSTEYIIDRIDEAARFNTSNKQVCNEALCLARGRLQSLQNELEAKTRFIKELEDKLRKYEEVDMEQGRWISCSERMPNKFDNVLIQIKINDKPSMNFVPRTGYIGLDNQWYIHLELGKPVKLYSNYKVVAWQSLPEKYVESEMKEKAEAKLERGDYVICKNKYVKTFEALYLGADYKRYIVIDKDYTTPHVLNIEDWTLTKTGKHVHLFDIDERGN